MQQMDSLLRHGDQIVHGPTRFSDFSVETLTDEVRSNAPDVYQLFLRLGDTERNGSTPVEQRKAIMSLCTLLNAWQRRANGL